MAEISYVVSDKRVQLRIRAIEERISASGMAAFFMSVGTNYLQGRATARFEGGGDDASGKWHPLSPHTIRDKVEAGLDPRINIRTGAMKAYVESAPGYVIGGGSAGTTFGWPRASPSKDIQDRIRLAQFGSAKLGIDRGDVRDVPARPVIAADAGDMMTLAKLLDSYIGSQ